MDGIDPCAGPTPIEHSGSDERFGERLMVAEYVDNLFKDAASPAHLHRKWMDDGEHGEDHEHVCDDGKDETVLGKFPDEFTVFPLTFRDAQLIQVQFGVFLF
jgi:hypothetical protein